MTGCELALAGGYARALRRRSARGQQLTFAELRWLVQHERRVCPITQPKEPRP